MLVLKINCERFALWKWAMWVIRSFGLCFPFLCPRANWRSHSFSLIRSLLKSDLSHSLQKPSHPSLQKSDREQFAQASHDKRATGAIHNDSLFFISESLFFSFAHKKQANCSKNQWANSQPWNLVIMINDYVCTIYEEIQYIKR